MQTRRKFIARGMALAGAFAGIFGRRSGASVARPESSRASSFGGSPAPDPVIVGGPTPAHLIKGKPGSGYFKAAIHDLPDHRHAYLDGREIDCFCSEFDLEGQWARLWDANADGSIRIYDAPVKRHEYLYDKNWNRVGRSYAVERIHFGKVEVR
jgi:hypothetical protein